MLGLRRGVGQHMAKQFTVFKFPRVATEDPGTEVLWTLADLVSSVETRATKKASPLWCPSVLIGGRPARVCVQSAAVLVYDFDKNSLTEFEASKKLVAGLGWQYLLHTTFSHMEAGKGCNYRVAFPLAEPVNAATYMVLWRKIKELFMVNAEPREKGQASFLDNTKVGPESRFYEPVKQLGLEEFFEEVHDFEAPCLTALDHVAYTEAFTKADRPAMTEDEAALELCTGEDETAYVDLALKIISESADGEKQETLYFRSKDAGAAYARMGKPSSELDELAARCVHALAGRADVEDWPAAMETARRGTEQGWTSQKSTLVHGDKVKKAFAGASERMGKVIRSMQGRNDVVREQKRFDKVKKELRGALKKNGTDIDAVKQAARAAGPMQIVLGDLTRDLLGVTEGLTTLAGEKVLETIVAGTAEGQDEEEEKRQSGDWTTKLIKNKDGAVIKMEENIVTLLSSYPSQEGNVRWNSRHGEIEWYKPTFWSPRDGEVVDEQVDKQSFMMAVSKTLPITGATSRGCFEILIDYAGQYRYDPWLEYLETCFTKVTELGLDSYDLLERAMIVPLQLTSVEDEEYHKKLTCYFFANSVRRTLEPGCTSHCMPVLCGNQRVGKSRWCSTLVAGNKRFFEDGDLKLEDKDTIIRVSQKVIYEWSELSGIAKKDMEKLKAFLSSDGSSVRAAFKQVDKYYPRRSVLIGTSNKNNFNGDATGGRRYWPVEVTAKVLSKEGFAWYEENLDLIWGLAYKWVQEGKPLDFSDEDRELFVLDKQAAAQEEHPYTTTVAEFLDTTLPSERWATPLKDDTSRAPTYKPYGSDEEKVRVLERQFESGVMQYCTLAQAVKYLGLNEGRESKVVATALRSCGWQPKQRTVFGKNTPVWVKK